VTFLCQLDSGAFDACSSPTTYFGLGEGSHNFSVEAQDAAGNLSGAKSFSWTIDTTPPPAPAITSTPTNPTRQSRATFSFEDTETGVSFWCSLDVGVSHRCASLKTYTALQQGSHTFSVQAKDVAGNQSGASSFTWTVDTTAPPRPDLTSKPTNPSNQTSASFDFTDTEAGVTFQCRLDNSTFSDCSSPVTYSGLADGKHTFSVKAVDAAGNPSRSANFLWTVDTIAPPTPVITSMPPDPTNKTTATFRFSDSEKKVRFLCQLDGSGFSPCTSSQKYNGLTVGKSHVFG
jgi:hypothetical protein